MERARSHHHALRNQEGTQKATLRSTGTDTHHLSCCRPRLKFCASSPIRSRTAPATCCSKAPPVPPTRSLQIPVGDLIKRPRPSLTTQLWALNSHSPLLTVEILGPVGDIKLLVSLTGLLPPPFGSLVGSWLWLFLAHNLCEDTLAGRGPVSLLRPRGVPLEPRGQDFPFICQMSPARSSSVSPMATVLESSAGRRGHSD